MPKSSWWAYLVVFAASGCTLILEIVAGRIIAPVVGVSLYTWTSVIGVVLAGISLGNFSGGLAADRWPARRTLGIILALGGVSSLAVLPLIKLTTDYHYPPGFPLLAKILVMTAAIFFPPAFIISMTTPVVIKLSLKDLGQTGGVVGRLYAVSTCGSILSTFLTGFVLIASFGTRGIVLGVGALLILLALAFGGLLSREPLSAASSAVIVGGLCALALGAAANLHAFDSGCTRETNYYCIRAVPAQVDGRPVEELILDHLIHSYNDVNDPTYLHYGYEKVYAEVLAGLGQPKPDLSVLQLGGGGYTMPRYITTVYPQAHDEVLEIDPGVTAVAHQSMGLPAGTPVRTLNVDARLGLRQMAPDQQFDLVLGDAFNDLSVPYHLTTREFDQELSARMSPDGVYLANIIDKMQGGRFIPSVVRTLQTVFPHVYVMSEVDSFQSAAQNTYVVAASKAPIDVSRLQLTKVMPADQIQLWLTSADSVLLTDDYVPTDNLLAPLFLERN